ncbi:glutathione S-transferase [Marinilabilia rubra]|uniref:Glutathione S-transferase n=1 Tax=Marinilabilia rubra TaxID=2162893 RepID=A0A2U2BE69_9BACT|nr:glutathione S-transferase family protein [Marinilabilia rubra]PWE01348.1 glutathione S-transferase [Marinilabilia rubra]
MNCKLYYWPAPFRGNFIRLLLEEAGEKYQEASVEEILELYSKPVEVQPLPMMAPPYLHDLDHDVFLSQMPVIVMHLSRKLGFLPDDAFKSSVCLKLVLDSNDILAEITNLNGNTMWEYEKWKEFRQKRLKRWLEMFEETGKGFGLSSKSEYMLGGDQISMADLVTEALWGTMIRCFPDLAEDCRRHAPNVFQLIQRIEIRPKIKSFIERQQQSYGSSYCGGQIEKSIRSMLEKDRQ